MSSTRRKLQKSCRRKTIFYDLKKFRYHTKYKIINLENYMHLKRTKYVRVIIIKIRKIYNSNVYNTLIELKRFKKNFKSSN